ncbi:MAG: nucleotidyltransferase family protein [Bacteroidales bacterium]|nr:nucleotidyltransferase family protein [Bacteroidales bacterium]
MTEIQLAYNLLRAAIDGQAPLLGTRPIEASMWWNLFRLMQQNHVAAMTADTVAALDVPREVKIPWLSERDKAARWHRYQREVQQEIADTMSRNGIDTLVLKGTHTAQYYPVPELREFGDLDLYFYNRHDEADRVAQKSLRVIVSNEAHHHSKYDYRGVTVESHYDFINVHYPPSNRRYEAMLKELAPSPTFEVLFLLRHMAGHFAAARITLRDLVDWTLTCRALNDKVDWGRVQDIATEYGMSSFVRALSLVAEHQLGIPMPLQLSNGPDDIADRDLFERDIVYGSVDDHAADGVGRLGWKFRRWNVLAWKRRMVYSDSSASLWLASLTSHTMKPQSFLHKQ